MTRAPSEADFSCLASLRRDKDVQHLVLGYPPEQDPTDDEIRSWIKRKSEAADGCFFAIVTPEGRTIGFVQLHGVHRAGRYAHFGVVIEGSARGNGHAIAAVREVINYGQQRHNLAKVLCEVRADNTASQRMCEKLGFRQAGLLQAHYHGHDVLIYEKLLAQRSDFMR